MPGTAGSVTSSPETRSSNAPSRGRRPAARASTVVHPGTAVESVGRPSSPELERTTAGSAGTALSRPSLEKSSLELPFDFRWAGSYLSLMQGFCELFLDEVIGWPMVRTVAANGFDR